MATIKERKLKNGQEAYDIQVYVEGKLKSTTWRRPKEITDNREAKRLLNKIALEFEEKQRAKEFDYKDNVTFSEFATEWQKDSVRNNSPTYYGKSEKLIEYINRFIGDIPLAHLKPIHIKKILDYLNDRKVITERAKLKKPLDEVIKNLKVRKISLNAGVSYTTFLYVRKGNLIEWSNAVKYANELGINVNEYFEKITSTRPYSKGSKDRYKRLINAILNRAVQLELIPNNPAKKVFTKNSISGKVKEKDILTLEETKQFKSALLSINDSVKLREKTAIALLFYMAMRLGEVAGLEWKDVDFENNTLHIRRSTIYVSSKIGLITKEPKTKTSNRKLKMPNVMACILKEYKHWYDNEKQRLGDVWIDKDRVIPRWNGKIITPSTIRLWLKKLLMKNGLRIVSPHSLRHTNITIQLREKIPPKAVARFAGHSDPSVTLDVYSHFLQEDEDDYIELFDNLFTD